MSQREFNARFGTEELCREYMLRKKWPGGFICPRCGSQKYYYLSNGRYQCANCYRQTSLTAGTIMNRSHVPLTKWFEAMYMIARSNDMVTAKQAQEKLHVTYKTAWYLLSRIRSATTPESIVCDHSGQVDFDDALFDTMPCAK